MNLNKLRAKRVEYRYTQCSLGKQLGVSTPTYRSKEIGNVPFTNIEISKLKQVLKLTIAEIDEIFF